jgi:hypothetical protein
VTDVDKIVSANLLRGELLRKKQENRRNRGCKLVAEFHVLEYFFALVREELLDVVRRASGNLVSG